MESDLGVGHAHLISDDHHHDGNDKGCDYDDDDDDDDDYGDDNYDDAEDDDKDDNELTLGGEKVLWSAQVVSVCKQRFSK